MYYDYELTVYPDDTKDKPAEMLCPLVYGILRDVSITFPAGVHRVTKITVWHFERQLHPTNPEMSFSSNDFTIGWQEYYPIIEVPYLLKVRGWNEGGSYPHTIRCRFNILNPNVVNLGVSSPVSREELEDILGEYESAGVL